MHQMKKQIEENIKIMQQNIDNAKQTIHDEEINLNVEQILLLLLKDDYAIEALKKKWITLDMLREETKRAYETKVYHNLDIFCDYREYTKNYMVGFIQGYHNFTHNTITTITENAETIKTIEKAFLEHTPIDTLYEKYGKLLTDFAIELASI